MQVAVTDFWLWSMQSAKWTNKQKSQLTLCSASGSCLLQSTCFDVLVSWVPFLPFNLCFIKALIIHNTGSNFAIILQTLLLGMENTQRYRGGGKSHSWVPPRGFIQSIEKINYSHTIHLALLLDWQKMLLGLSAVLSAGEWWSICFGLRCIGGKWREICTLNANIRQLFESRRYDEGTALEANGASVGSVIPA